MWDDASATRYTHGLIFAGLATCSKRRQGVICLLFAAKRPQMAYQLKARHVFSFMSVQLLAGFTARGYTSRGNLGTSFARFGSGYTQQFFFLQGVGWKRILWAQQRKWNREKESENAHMDRGWLQSRVHAQQDKKVENFLLFFSWHNLYHCPE